MKVRMASEWRSLGHFAVDHFAIVYGCWDGVPSERVESVHRHYLNCYFKVLTYSEDFSDEGFRSNLNANGHVFPFEKVSQIMGYVLKGWDKRLVYPYSEKLSWESDPDEHTNWRAIWRGHKSDESIQRVFRREWSENEDDNKSYYKNKTVREFSRDDYVPEWDDDLQHSYISLKQLSIASQRGTKEEIIRELSMDFLFLLILFMNNDDLNRIYKITFRLDDEANRECGDFGTEMTVKGLITDVVNLWEKQLVLRYAKKIGAKETIELLKSFGASYGHKQALKLLLRKVLTDGFFFPNNGTAKEIVTRYRKEIKETVFLRSLRQVFVYKAEDIRSRTGGGVARPQEVNELLKYFNFNEFLEDFYKAFL